MADSLDLFSKDYDQYIEHCKECAGTLALKDFIDFKVNKYRSQNLDMVLCLIERIEKNYPDCAIDDSELEHPFHSEEISNFLLDSDIHNAPIKWLFSYLCFLDNEEGQPKNPLATAQPRISFKIDKVNEYSLLDLAKKLDVHFNLFKNYGTNNIAKRFVEVMISDDILSLDKESYEIYFNCETYIITYIFAEIKEAYNSKSHPIVIEKSGLFFSKQLNLLKAQSFYTENNRIDTKSGTEHFSKIRQIFRECAPSKYL